MLVTRMLSSVNHSKLVTRVFSLVKHSELVTRVLISLNKSMLVTCVFFVKQLFLVTNTKYKREYLMAAEGKKVDASVKIAVQMTTKYILGIVLLLQRDNLN